MTTRRGDDSQGGTGSRQLVERAVAQLVTLLRNDEACRLLGVDGVLVDQTDITFLEDPLEYVASDIAIALRDVEEGVVPGQASMLSTLMAELRLYGIVSGHAIDQHELTERVLRHLREMQA